MSENAPALDAVITLIRQGLHDQGRSFSYRLSTDEESAYFKVVVDGIGVEVALAIADTAALPLP